MHQWNGETYHKSSSEQQRWARELITKLHLNGDERILDIGCGDGKVTAEIAGHLQTGSIVGIDSSDSMIHFAQSTFPTSQHSNLEFQQMDARALTFQNEFDVVFSNAALHWIIDHLPVLHGIQQSLKSSGKLLLQMGGKGNAAKKIAVMETIMAHDTWKPYFQDFTFPYGFYTPEAYTQWLMEAGFTPQRVELIPKMMRHNGTGGLKNWIRTTWHPYMERIPEHLRGDFINEIVHSYTAQYPADAEGILHVEMVRLEVEAVKT